MKRFALAMLSLAALSAPAASNLLVNGDFESVPAWGTGISGDPGYMALINDQLPGWTIEPNHAVTIHNTVLYPTLSGNFSINTDGEGWQSHNADMRQDFPSVVGRAYTLQFDWKPWYANNPTLDVSITDTITGAVLAHGSYLRSDGLHHETLAFIGTGAPLRLRVKHAPESLFNDNTFILDNFVVERVNPRLPGDIDDDGDVDIDDYDLLAAAYGSFSGDARYTVACDLDADGDVDIDDYDVLAANYGRTE